ncbi:asparagine-linked glycosylation protein [Tulasnella sp. 331]|nr:asparagine-linked glycosylation protein [Tulasnella sp. 331]KAG8886670.1 asparagine-linked glycosylation protein [Tulasnella sp. 332]
MLNASKALSSQSSVKKTIVGFFHPYCNAGGGGEVVLWSAVAYMQKTEPDVLCVVYTGDKDATKEQIIAKVKSRFDIDLNPTSLSFVWLNTRRFVDASTWPRITLLGQSLGSVILAIEAIDALVPDVFIDSMGYAFTFPLVALTSRFFCPISIGSYVHYPTISTDMLQRVKDRKAGHTNTDAVTKSKWKSTVKLLYYHVFAFLYSFCLLCAHKIVVNSSWTKNHIDSLLETARERRRWITNSPPSITGGVHILYPPCGMDKLRVFSLEGRQRIILSVAQFRPEKEHAVQIRAFKLFLDAQPKLRSSVDSVRLVLIGGCRTEEDERRVEDLKKLAKELGVQDNIEFVVNAPYSVLLDWFSKSSVGISTMVDEHFGINVVEYMAAGLIPLVNASGGPFSDIVIPYSDGGKPQPTGFHAKSPEDYATALEDIFVRSSVEDLAAIRERARASSLQRFANDEFEKGWSGFWGALKDWSELQKSKGAGGKRSKKD